FGLTAFPHEILTQMPIGGMDYFKQTLFHKK
ncbi:MAG: hypothetical protein ACI9JR_001234, partial [Gammaproteobacteria bacterium]